MKTKRKTPPAFKETLFVGERRKSKIDHDTRIHQISEACSLDHYYNRYRTKKGYSYAWDILPVSDADAQRIKSNITKKLIKMEIWSKIVHVMVSPVKMNPIRREWRTIRILIRHDHAKKA